MDQSLLNNNPNNLETEKRERRVKVPEETCDDSIKVDLHDRAAHTRIAHFIRISDQNANVNFLFLFH